MADATAPAAAAVTTPEVPAVAVAPASSSPVSSVAPVIPSAAQPVQAATDTPPVSPPALSSESETPAADIPAEAPEAAETTEKPQEPEGDKPEGQTAEEPAQPTPPAYEFKMPEGFTADEPTLGAYRNILLKGNIAPEIAQELLDFHANTMRTAQSAMDQRQRDVFAEFNKKSVDEFYKAAGNRADTMLNSVKTLVAELVPDKKQRAEVWADFSNTGAGNRKSIIFLLAAAAKRLREPTAPSQGLPVNGTKSGRPEDRRYGPQK